MWTNHAFWVLTVCKLGNRNLECGQSLKAVWQKSWFRYLEYSPSYGQIYAIGLTLMYAACRLLVLPIYSDLLTSKKKCLSLEESTDAQNMFLCLEGFKMLPSHAGLHLNFMNPCKGGKSTSCRHSVSFNSSFAVNALVYIALVLAVEVALFNPLFMEVLRINK